VPTGNAVSQTALRSLPRATADVKCREAVEIVENNTVATERDPPSFPKGGVFRSGGTRSVVSEGVFQRPLEGVLPKRRLLL